MKINFNDGFNILFTCVGRRVSLLNSFKESAARLGQSCKLCGADTTPLAAGMQASECYYVVSPTTKDTYIDELCDIVRRENINILIPTTDHDLQDLASNRKKFEALGCFVLVPSLEVVRIFQDKRRAFKQLKSNGFTTPQTFTPEEFMNNKSMDFPCFLKPWDGYASRGATVANSYEELEFHTKRIPNCIVQQYIKGSEITCDVFIDAAGKARCVVPRKRIEVRGGEVSKAVIVKDEKIIEKVAELAESLKTHLCVLTIQLLKTQENQLYFIEINPRFGGGVPLAIKAGADLPLWLLESLLKGESGASNDYIDNLTMLRYDAEIWV